MTRPCVVKLVMMILSIGYVDFVSDWARIVRASFCFRSSTTREEVPSRCARARRRPALFNPSVRGGGVCRRRRRQSINQSINQSIGSDIIGHHRTSSDIGHRGGEKIVTTNDLMIHDSWNHSPTRASIDFDRSVDFEG